MFNQNLYNRVFQETLDIGERLRSPELTAVERAKLNERLDTIEFIFALKLRPVFS